MKRKIGIIISGLLFTGNVFSQVAELDPATVTASLTQKKSSETGRNIISIKGDQFNNLPVHSIDELLRYLPGIEVQQRGAMGSQSDIVIRGGTYQQVLIVLDGIRLNDPNTGHFNSYIPIAPSEIDRIEILKGASSAIYGSEAVGGVINIISKTFAATLHPPQGDKKELSVTAAGGEYGLWSVNAGGFYQKGNTAISGGVLTNNTDGQLQRGTRGYLNNTTASLSFSQWLSKNWQLSLQSSYDTRKFSAQNFYTTYVSDTAQEQVKTFWNQAQLSYQKNKDKFNLNFGYKAVEDEYAFNPGLTPNNNKSKLFQALAIYGHKFSNATNLVSGSQFQNRTIRSNDRGNHEVKQAAAFVILNQTIGANFFVSPALRLDWDERGGTELVPQINLSYKLHQLQLRGSAGKTIRQADFTERFNNYNKAFVTGGSIGNPDLEAERSFSYEAGADYWPLPKSLSEGVGLKLSVTAFRREQTNVIDWTPTPYNQMPRKDNLSLMGNYALASNIAAVTTSGLETDIQFNKHYNKHHTIFAAAGLVWLDSKTSETTPSFYISSHAKFLANFNAGYANRYFSFSINGIYKHRTPQKASAINAEVDADCFMLNTKADVFLYKNKLSAFVEVDNVSDNGCGDLLGSKLPGRWLMGGLTFKIR